MTFWEMTFQQFENSLHKFVFTLFEKGVLNQIILRWHLTWNIIAIKNRKVIAFKTFSMLTC